jgi:hypothetical protein
MHSPSSYLTTSNRQWSTMLFLILQRVTGGVAQILQVPHYERGCRRAVHQLLTCFTATRVEE